MGPIYRGGGGMARWAVGKAGEVANWATAYDKAEEGSSWFPG